MKDNEKIASGLLVIALFIIIFIVFIVFFIELEESIFSSYFIQSNFNGLFLVTDLDQNTSITASGRPTDPHIIWHINQQDIRIPLTLMNDQGCASVSGQSFIISTQADAPLEFNWNVNNTFTISTPSISGFLTVDDDGNCAFEESADPERQLFTLIRTT